MNIKKIDFILLITFPILASIISLTLNVNFFYGTLLFFGVPSLYLSIRNKKVALKTFLFSLIFAAPLALISDYIASISGTWLIETSALLGFRFFGIVSPEGVIWGFFYIYFVIIFYEHFIDKGKNKLVVGNFKYIVLFIIILLAVFLLALYKNSSLLNIKYFYLIYWGGIMVILPIVSFFSFFPENASKFIKVGVYFFVLTILYELVALKLGHWSFPGKHFIGWVELFGLGFPFEEFFYWIILGAVATLSWYEFFADDKK